MEPTNYASFGRRLVAVIIDSIVMSVVIFPVMALLGYGAASGVDSTDMQGMTDAEMAGVGLGLSGGVMLLTYGVQVLYYFLMESSAKQATLGKIVMGIKVTDLEGNRLSQKAAIIRAIMRLVSGFIIGIGFIMAAFTQKKQALHDMVANTLVLK